MQELGRKVGFQETSADVRIAQYESCSRKPKEDLLIAIAQALEVRVETLDVPDIDSKIGLCQTLFALEDMYGLSVAEIDGQLCLRVNEENPSYEMLNKILTEWYEKSKEYKEETTSKEEYDQWRYNYKMDSSEE